MVNDSVHHNCSLNMISNYTAMSRAPVFIPIMLFQRNFSMFPSPRYEFSASVSLPTVENWLDQPLFSLWNPENVNLYIILLLFITVSFVLINLPSILSSLYECLQGQSVLVLFIIIFSDLQQILIKLFVIGSRNSWLLGDWCHWYLNKQEMKAQTSYFSPSVVPLPNHYGYSISSILNLFPHVLHIWNLSVS